MTKTLDKLTSEGRVYDIEDIGQFDVVRYQHTAPMELEGYHYRLPCFCGGEIKLVPENGQKAKCPTRGCKGRARFENSKATLELEGAS